MNAASAVQQMMPVVRTEIERFLPPVVPLTHRIEELVRPFSGIGDILDANNLKQQLDLIHLLIDHRLISQAYALAREWIVSALLFSLGKTDEWLLYDPYRKTAEQTLNAAIPGRNAPDTPMTEEFARLPEKEGFIRAWNAVSEIRNDLMHCGMRTDALDGKKVIEKSKQLIQILEQVIPNGG